MRKPFSLLALTSLFFAAIISLASPASAQSSALPTTVPSIEQALSMKSVSDPQMSPDGRFVAYVETSTDWDANAFVRQIWIAVIATGQTYQLTQGKKSSSDPQWSPDARWLAFTSDRAANIPDTKTDTTQLYIISPAGGEARQLTSVETGVSDYQWSPDSKRIAFTSEDPESDAHKARVKKYGDFHIIDSDYTMTHLWLINVSAPTDLASPKPERLTSGDQFTVHGFRWSPDGSKIAFDATRDPALANEGTSDIYIVNVSDKSEHKLTDGPGPNRNPFWSPDGSQIAYTTADGNPYYYYSNELIAVVPSSGGMPKILTSDFDEDPGMLAWAPDGIYFEASQRTYNCLFRLDPKSLTIFRLTPQNILYGDFTFSKDFSRMAFAGARNNAFIEIYSSPLSPFTAHKISDVSAQYASFHLATRELVHWTSGDGTPIEGILIKPANFDPAKKYPLLVEIHGGPTGTSRATRSPDRYYPVEVFAARGALVLEPNYRGSAGYGAKFRALNVRNLGVGDYADVISGVDYLISQGYVDPAKVGSMGWSEGGYISEFITTFSDRFCAVSAGAGISDWMTYYVNTDITPFTRQYLHATPWADPDIYKKTSPITYITHAHTPTLIQQGSKDARVPVPDSFELYRGLKDQGVPAKFVLFDGFGHPITKPKQLLQVTEENWDWFGHYIWGDPLPASLQP